LKSSAPDPALEYVSQVIDGEIVAGELVRLACERHLEDLKTAQGRGLRFDVALGNRAINFFELGHHIRGRWARGACTCVSDPARCPSRIELLPWQKFNVASVFGWLRAGSSGGWVRRFVEWYLQVARKNAKTTIGALAGLYLLTMDDEPGAEVYSAATKRDQARIMWDTAAEIARRTPGLAKRIALPKPGARNVANMHVLSTASKFEPLGADADTTDGLNPSGALIDEFHAHKTGDLADVLTSGTGARDQPLVGYFTTAGLNADPTTSACRAQRDYCAMVLRGELEDDSVFAYIAELDESDEWNDRDVWAKANPMLGHSIMLEELEKWATKAERMPRERATFKAKRLDMWVDGAGSWLELDEWNASPACDPIDVAALHGRECFGGLDLASRKDLTAFSLLFPPLEPDDPYQALVWFWSPERMIKQRKIQDRAILTWLDQGFIEATEGNTVHLGLIRKRINEISAPFNVREIGFDPWNAAGIQTDLTDDGFLMVELRQGFATLSPPTKELETLVLDRRLQHGANPVLTWNARNARVRTDPNENLMICRRRSTEKIDGLAALIFALQRKMKPAESQTPSRYENPGAEMIVG